MANSEQIRGALSSEDLVAYDDRGDGGDTDRDGDFRHFHASPPCVCENMLGRDGRPEHGGDVFLLPDLGFIDVGAQGGDAEGHGEEGN